MSQHYTLATVEVSAWCNRCRKNTPHRVAERRLQYCIPCWEHGDADSKAAKSEAKSPVVEQSDLFGGSHVG
jgi:ribosomal protein L44E